MIKIFATFLCLLLFVSCGGQFNKDEIVRQRDLMRSLIVQSFPSNFTVTIHNFTNVSKDADLEYMSKAVPDVFYSFLKPMEYEKIYVPYEKLDFSISTDMINLIQLSNTIFSNYLTRLPYEITQYITNMNASTITQYTTYSNYIDSVAAKKTKEKELQLIVLTNIMNQIETNLIISNIVKTNHTEMSRSNLLALIAGEYPDLKDKLTYIPVTINKENESTQSSNQPQNLIPVANNPMNISNSVTNTNTISSNYFADITGLYETTKRRNGPNEILVRMTIKKVVSATNYLNLTINTREDTVSERMYQNLKPIRIFFLNQPTGDLSVITTPDEANIYMDGVFIGKSPLYYPAVPIGTHQFSFLKEGYHQLIAQGSVLLNLTNQINKSIIKLQTGGKVNIDSTPSNTSVFVDSVFVGNTPVELTNLSIGVEHRVKVQSMTSNLFPSYFLFTLTNTNQTYSIHATLPKFEGSSSFDKGLAWWLTFGCWGGTLGLIGYNIYTDYMMNYYGDQFAYNGTGYNYYVYFRSLNDSSRTYALLATFVSFGVTAYALSREEIFLGFQYNPQRGIYTSLTFSY